MLRAITDTSMAAYRNIPTPTLSGQKDAIKAIIEANGSPMSGQQIKAAYFRKYGVSLDTGTISARVNAMCNSQPPELQRRTKKITCPISKQLVNPIGLPIVQLELIN